MQILTTASQMHAYAKRVRSSGRTIGFVPTMGALHEGHATLVKAAKNRCDVVVVSVFVNPTQFNQTDDLEKYPRTFEADRSMLIDIGANAMFFPSVDEVYPKDVRTNFNMDGLDQTMEGPNRPGHFNGVVQVVMRLFDLTQPTVAFFGEKDFQQLTIIKYMTNKLGYPVSIVGCPTVRENDGLAMSSRNVRLTPNERRIAPVIYETLTSIKTQIATLGPAESRKNAINKLIDIPELKLEYLELVDPVTLETSNEDSESIQACIAVWVGDVRLIDNMRVK
ncbi:MAG: pantoate--beta-alanine ligase [Flavobacteriales bacterium]|nr:pantoate--beta-alanine ligase [Flavobacteriales bacterium]